MQEQFSFGDIVPLIRKNFKVIAGLTILAGVLAGIFSGPSFIKPRFKSSAIVYPSNLSPYSKETRTEQLIQLLQSSDIRDTLVKKFDLYKKYEIEAGKPGAKFEVEKAYNDFVGINKTKFESIEINVEDYSPDTAMLMVREIITQVNLKARKLQREKSAEILVMTGEQIDYYEAHLDSVEKRLNELREQYGLLDYETQTQEVTQGYFRVAAAGKGGEAKRKAEKILEGLAKHGGEFQRLSVLKELGEEELAELYTENQSALNDINKKLTYTNEVVSPAVPDKKSYPIRWLIVFTAVFATALFSTLLLLVFNASKSW
ncbi:Wzz/FepE/Etk N-terminal domain-containing protein [Luteibaculum oceani]|nr:Wzz/FepE/Etk N-terminal domain-containing protein [Luteibaculum oceani]